MTNQNNLDTARMLKAITDCDPSYEITTIGKLASEGRLPYRPGADSGQLLGSGVVDDSTFVVVYVDGEFIDLHEMSNDYQELVKFLYNELSISQ